MPLVISVTRPRHHVLLIGTGSYTSEEWNSIAFGVRTELELASNIFRQKLEYDDCQEVFPKTDRSLGSRVSQWGKGLQCGKNDVVVVYYTGHGHVDGGQLRLITSDIQPGEENTAIPASDFVSWLSHIEAHILVIVDTCYSGAVALDALVLLDRRQKQNMQFITSASSIEEARPGWFIEALSPALDEVATRFDESRPMEKVLDSVNRALKRRSIDYGVTRFREKLAAESLSEREIRRMADEERERITQDPKSDQIARFSGVIEELSRFFPNRGRLEFKASMDRELALRVLHSIQKDALRNHWDPKARGVKQESEPGWFFSGRHKALAYLKNKIATSVNSILVVSGMSGSGKSALLARFVTLADPQQRERAKLAGATKGVPATGLPDPNSVDIAVWAKDRSVFSLAQEIATAAGSDLHGEWEVDPVSSLANALRLQKSRRRILIVDALDEADKPFEAAFLLQELVQENCGLLVIVGIRSDPTGSSPVISRLGPVDILNLDNDEYWELEDVACYVNRFLLAQVGSPYRNLSDENYVREVADAVASKAQRSFLVATTAAQSLAKREKPIAREELPNLPTNAGGAFEMDLKRFKSEWRQGMHVLGTLAYGRGEGFPRCLWPEIVDALQPGWGATVKYWEDAGGFYVSRSQVGGEEVCRLYHPEFTRHLRTKLDQSSHACRDAECSHSSPVACVAMVLLNKVKTGADRDKVSHYVLEHLARYLGEAGLRQQLYELVTSPGWHEIKNKVYQDPTSLLKDLAVGMETAAHDPPDLRTLVHLSAMSSRQLTPASAVSGDGTNMISVEAPSIVIATLAQAGQLGRARMLADNVLFPLDRCHAFSMLAQWYHRHGAKDEPLSCLAEAKRIAAAIRTDFRAMGFFWITRAAHQIGERREARIAADQALSSVTDPESAPTPSLFGSLHAAVWAGLCLRQLGDIEKLENLKTVIESSRWRLLGGVSNLSLQAAFVTGDRQFLRRVLNEKLAHLKEQLAEYPDYLDNHPYTGNLALALASGGMLEEFYDLEKGLRELNKWPGVLYNDAGKRFVWALAIRQRFEEALEVVHRVEPFEERVRALYRIAECAANNLSPHLQLQIGITADQLLHGLDQASGSDPEAWRIHSWLAPVYLVAGNATKAIELCNAVCASGIVVSRENSLCLTASPKQHVTVTLDPTEDERLLTEIYGLLAKNQPHAAEDRLEKIRSQRIHARAAVAIAARSRDRERALRMLLDAIKAASRGGVGEFKNILDQSRPVLARISPETDFAVLEAEFQNALGQS